MIHVKSEKEIDLIRESCKIVRDTLDFVGSKIQAGMSTKEVDELVERYIRASGANPSCLGYGGFPVSALQFMLEEISVFFPISAVRVDGIYGQGTRDAISELQARYLLPVTGETDKLTWNAVVRLYDSAKLYQ